MMNMLAKCKAIKKCKKYDNPPFYCGIQQIFKSRHIMTMTKKKITKRQNSPDGGYSCV